METASHNSDLKSEIRMPKSESQNNWMLCGTSQGCSADFQSAVSLTSSQQSVRTLPGRRIGNPRYSTARRSRNQTECPAASLRAPSPLNGERAEVRGGKVVELRPGEELRPDHPSPSFPPPVEGRGRPTGSGSGKLARLATIPGITNRLETCAALGAVRPHCEVSWWASFSGYTFAIWASALLPRFHAKAR